MPEEINTPTETTQPTKEKSFDWLKVILAIIIGFVLLAASAYAGYWYGTRSAKLKVQSAEPKLKTQNLETPTPEPTPSPKPIVDPTANWKTYRSSKVGYSIKAPPDWKVIPNEDDSLLSHQDYVTNMTLMPEGENEEGMIANAVVIAFPISIQGPHKDVGKQFESGLEGLALPSEPTAWFVKQEASYTQVGGRRTLVKMRVNKSVPPPDFVGGWCNCTQKDVYIDLGNGKILHILGYWQNDNPQFETTFDQILSTFKFLD